VPGELKRCDVWPRSAYPLCQIRRIMSSADLKISKILYFTNCFEFDLTPI